MGFIVTIQYTFYGSLYCILPVHKSIHITTASELVLLAIEIKSGTSLILVVIGLMYLTVWEMHESLISVFL
jgi:hypothetical protein